MLRSKRLELPHPYGHMHLKLMRLAAHHFRRDSPDIGREFRVDSSLCTPICNALILNGFGSANGARTRIFRLLVFAVSYRNRNRRKHTVRRNLSHFVQNMYTDLGVPSIRPRVLRGLLLCAET